MTHSYHDRVDAFILGWLNPEEEAELLSRAARDPALAADIAAARETYGALAASVVPVPPLPATRERLLASAAAGRLDRFAAGVARILDVAVSRAQELLAGIDRADVWTESPWPDVSLYHLEGGPATAAAIVGFVRVEPGGLFPDHEHLGEEAILVVQGSLIDTGDGSVARPGDEVHRAAGTTHAYRVADGPALVYLARVERGVRIGEVEMHAGDPRV